MAAHPAAHTPSTPSPLQHPAPAAIRVAIGMAKPREVVIVAGKGHVDYQEYWDGADMDNPDTIKVGAGLRGVRCVCCAPAPPC